MGTGTARRVFHHNDKETGMGGTEGLEDALSILPSFRHYPLRASLFESQQFSQNRWCPARAPLGQSRVPESADSRGQRQVREPVIFPGKRVLLQCAAQITGGIPLFSLTGPCAFLRGIRVDITNGYPNKHMAEGFSWYGSSGAT